MLGLAAAEATIEGGLLFLTIQLLLYATIGGGGMVGGGRVVW